MCVRMVRPIKTCKNEAGFEELAENIFVSSFFLSFLLYILLFFLSLWPLGLSFFLVSEETFSPPPRAKRCPSFLSHNIGSLDGNPKIALMCFHQPHRPWRTPPPSNPQEQTCVESAVIKVPCHQMKENTAVCWGFFGVFCFCFWFFFLLTQE